MCDNEQGWVNDDGYFVDSDGEVVTNEGWVNTDEKNHYGTWYYVGPDEKVIKGWNRIGGNFYYLYPAGSMTWENTIDGFYLEKSGRMVNGTGWLQDGLTGDYYCFSNGEPATGWQWYGSNWYYTDNCGRMVTGWYKVGEYWHYFNSDGSMATGWVEDNTGRYFLDDNGAMECNSTEDGYHLDSSGKMVTGRGWIHVDSWWYYLKGDGRVATKWLYDQNNWYYLYPEGSMAWGRTVDGCYLNDKGEWEESGGWKKGKDNDGHVIWYYVNSDGTAATGWIKDKGNWYHLNSSGVMETGWIKDNGCSYYLDEDGAMAHDTTIDGYYVNSDGAWEPSKDNSNTSDNSDSSNSQGTSEAKTVNVSMDVDTGTIEVTDSDNNSSTMELPTELYDATNDSGLANSSKAVLAKATIEWYNADTQDEKDIILAGIKGVRNYISEHSVSEWTEKFIADTINENIGGLVGIYGDYATGLTDVEELDKQVYYTKYAHVMRLVLSVTSDALNMGNKVHYDQVNGGTGEWLPTELKNMYDETTFNFTRRGQKGADIEYISGPHPSEYEINPMNWPEGFNYGDFKPYTASGYKTFLKDINKGKLPDDTVFLPYDPVSGKMKVPTIE